MPRNVLPLALVKAFGSKIQTVDLAPESLPRDSILKFKGAGRLRKERHELLCRAEVTLETCEEKTI